MFGEEKWEEREVANQTEEDEYCSLHSTQPAYQAEEEQYSNDTIHNSLW